MTRTQEEILSEYQRIKLHSEFHEQFVTDNYHPYYYCNYQTYTSLVHSHLVALKNGTSIKSYMAPLSYKVVTNRAYKISVWNFLSRIIHEREPYLGGINGDT